MKKRIIIVLGILIAAGGIGTGVWYHFKGNGQSGTGDSIVYVSKSKCRSPDLKQQR